MHDTWRGWLTTQALPLWSNEGFDDRRHLYHERLTWDGAPIAMAQLRLMVQARQVATYCRAALDGLYDVSTQAIRCLDEVERLYRHCDGASGWIFSLAPDGTPADRKRDLYAHAFILFAYAWAYELTKEEHYRRIARETVEEVHKIFAAANGGFSDAVPAPDTVRRQNPHMHLLEAYLALFEATREQFYLDHAKALVKFALGRFIDKRSDMLLEFFDAEWVPCEVYGKNRVEPGHLFEWAWLLREYERLVGFGGEKAAQIAGTADRLFAAGISVGIDPETGIAFDAMTEEGVVYERSTRIWPQTELMRLLCQRRRLGLLNDAILLVRLSHVFFGRYAPQRLSGGWIDRLDSSLTPLVDYMPASSLYHIYGPGRELGIGVSLCK
ncbi:mannose-6-phosphate isomerase [Gluconacetobacter aggeris]|uniref:Mannose-6-phosphate isomerase n=2 Tax=Gluconacetobacter aggeris TaxID=1286186 RepID=A0A7W4IV55_9PROT|nr:mannose-6-phosphate isomerase [Gluconacetobacter aggeris]